jgi:hypothetical protein
MGRQRMGRADPRRGGPLSRPSGEGKGWAVGEGERWAERAQRGRWSGWGRAAGTPGDGRGRRGEAGGALGRAAEQVCGARSAHSADRPGAGIRAHGLRLVVAPCWSLGS